LGDREEASDVAQETFIRLWQADVANQPPREAAAWIHRTAVHLAIDRLRKRTRTDNSTPHAEQPGPPPASDELLASRAHLELLSRRVPAEVLEAGVLHRVDGLTQPETARAMGCSERTVRRMLTELDARLERFRLEVLS
jgi:RNA polymerase sigma-70 factor (ECF subfamily)